MIKRAQFPFPAPYPKPVGASASLYWVALSACLAASWADGRADYKARDNFVDVAFEHLCMRAQAAAVGLDAEQFYSGVVPSEFGKDRPS